MACPFTARIVEPEETAFAREQPVNTFPQQRMHEGNNRGLLEAVFPMQSESNVVRQSPLGGGVGSEEPHCWKSFHINV